MDAGSCSERIQSQAEYLQATFTLQHSSFSSFALLIRINLGSSDDLQAAAGEVCSSVPMVRGVAHHRFKCSFRTHAPAKSQWNSVEDWYRIREGLAALDGSEAPY